MLRERIALASELYPSRDAVSVRHILVEEATMNDQLVGTWLVLGLKITSEDKVSFLSAKARRLCHHDFVEDLAAVCRPCPQAAHVADPDRGRGRRRDENARLLDRQLKDRRDG